MNHYFVTFEHFVHTNTHRKQCVVAAKDFGDVFLALNETHECPHILFCKNLTAEEYAKIDDFLTRGD